MELNYVSDGDYKNWQLKKCGDKFALVNPFGNRKVEIDDKSLLNVHVLSQNSNVKNTSVASKLINASIGGSLFGVAGMIVGATTNNQQINTTVNIMLNFKNGTKAIVEVNQQTYKSLVIISSNQLMDIPSDSENIDHLTKMKGDYWECRNCGRNNPNSSSRCSCGISKY